MGLRALQFRVAGMTRNGARQARDPGCPVWGEGNRIPDLQMRH
jgi:hypothetical protein